MRAREYLDIYKAYVLANIAESELGSGKTLYARFSESKGGNPATVPLISGTPELTAMAVDGRYRIVATPAIMAPLAPDHLMKNVYVHMHDGGEWRDVFPYVPTDTDADALPALQN